MGRGGGEEVGRRWNGGIILEDPSYWLWLSVVGVSVDSPSLHSPLYPTVCSIKYWLRLSNSSSFIKCRPAHLYAVVPALYYRAEITIARHIPNKRWRIAASWQLNWVLRGKFRQESRRIVLLFRFWNGNSKQGSRPFLGRAGNRCHITDYKERHINSRDSFTDPSSLSSFAAAAAAASCPRLYVLFRKIAIPALNFPLNVRAQ